MIVARLVTVLLILLGAVLPLDTAIAQDPDIRFGINAAPPFHIPESMQQKQQIPAGFCDALVETVSQQLPDHTIEVSRLPQIRIRRLMKREQNLCFPCLIKRSSYNPDYYFSDTVNLYPPHGIITRKSVAEQLRQQFGDQISFADIASQTELRFAQPSGRKYGDIQPILEEHLIDTDKYQDVFGNNATYNLLSMIATDRVDYTVDYPMMIKLYRQLGAVNTAESQLTFIPITEYQQKPIIGAIGCARTPWGKQAIDAINSVLPKIKQNKEFNRSLDFWLGADRPK
ncbi:MAG: hypothetical protein CMF12_07470 [Idiomarina sp.]|nr:hypothetical protein [Idiomarina sp.]